MKIYKTFTISVLIIVNLISCLYAQNDSLNKYYVSSPISEFFFPVFNKNQAEFQYIGDNNAQLSRLRWVRNYVTDNVNNSKGQKDRNGFYLGQIIDEQKYGTNSVSSIRRNLIITDRTVSIESEEDLQTKKIKEFTVPFILLVLPTSKGVYETSEYINDDKSVIYCKYQLFDYKIGNKVIPSIQVTERTVYKSPSKEIYKTYYYLFGYGYMQSNIYNKTFDQLRVFDELVSLSYDQKVGEYRTKTEKKLSGTIEKTSTESFTPPISKKSRNNNKIKLSKNKQLNSRYIH